MGNVATVSPFLFYIRDKDGCQMVDSFACPNCGTEVKVGTPACPNCGSDDDTGWSDGTLYDGLDLPESMEEYTRFKKKKNRSRVFTTIIALVLLILFVFSFVF